MPINIEIRKDNQLVTLNVPGKIPIISRRSSFNFHNPLELLCSALGACFANEFLDVCRFEQINPELFESLVVTMEDYKITVTIQHPEITEDLKKQIQTIANSCQVSKMLKDEINIVFIKNETPTEVLIDQTTKSKCCGK